MHSIVSFIETSCILTLHSSIDRIGIKLIEKKVNERTRMNEKWWVGECWRARNERSEDESAFKFKSFPSINWTIKKKKRTKIKHTHTHIHRNVSLGNSTKSIFISIHISLIFFSNFSFAQHKKTYLWSLCECVWNEFCGIGKKNGKRDRYSTRIDKWISQSERESSNS